jgi:GT2 family glycosyltransferase
MEAGGRIVVSSTAAVPAVSIIIPLYNQVELTHLCLAALERYTAGDRYELVLVDNGSSDGTAGLLAQWEGRATIVRNLQNRGFAAACNQGARSAKGKYLLFLNNDTEVTNGWLEPLVTTLDQDDLVSAVGSKLLYPDGTIQHAGVTLIDDRQAGDPLLAKNQFVGFPADHPPANILRRVQSLTAACLMVRRDAFVPAGGFDEGYWNGYEDVDLCLNLAQGGGVLVYQPASAVIHHESRSGTERFRRAGDNIRRLHDRWLGKSKVDAIIQSDGDVQIGPAVAEGRVGPYHPPQPAPPAPEPERSVTGTRYPLIPLVAHSSASILQRITSSQRLKSVLLRYTAED